jgi:hypothetical protein
MEEIQMTATLTMPKNYVAIEAEEMEYLEGGANRNAFVSHWWGGYLYMNNATTNRYINSLNGTASATGLIAAILTPIPGINKIGAPIAAIVTAGLRFGSWAVANANRGRGVRIRLTGMVMTGVWSQ